MEGNNVNSLLGPWMVNFEYLFANNFSVFILFPC